MKKYALMTALLLAMVVCMGATCAGSMQAVALGPDGKPLLDGNNQPIILTHEVDYFTSIALSNQAMAQNPRVAKVSFKPDGAKDPVTMELPLDSWRRSDVPDSYGKQVKEGASGVTPGFVVWTAFDAAQKMLPQAGNRSNYVQQTSTGDLAPNLAPGGNAGPFTGGLTSPAPVIYNPPVFAPSPGDLVQ